MTTIISLIETIVSIFSFISGITFAVVGYFFHLPVICLILLAMCGFSGLFGVWLERHISRKHASEAK